MFEQLWNPSQKFSLALSFSKILSHHCWNNSPWDTFNLRNPLLSWFQTSDLKMSTVSLPSRRIHTHLWDKHHLLSYPRRNFRWLSLRLSSTIRFRQFKVKLHSFSQTYQHWRLDLLKMDSHCTDNAWRSSNTRKQSS